MAHRNVRLFCIVVLACLSFALYFQNLDDYFLGDDFDLVNSFYGQPPGYFFRLLYSNESGTVWSNLGFGEHLDKGYLRPIKIWLMKLDFMVWGTNSFGFHLTATAFFALNVIVVFLILRALLPGREYLAFLGGWITAIHPLFSEIVPCITFREETVANSFSLFAILAFLRHRLSRASLLPFYVFYALALLTKESAIGAFGLALAYDLAHGHVRLKRDAIRRAARTYAPVAAILIIYFALRWIAFGNLIGGRLGATHGEPRVLVNFYKVFFASLFHERMFSLDAVPFIEHAVALSLCLATAIVVAHRRELGREYLANLVFVGPLWFLCTTVPLSAVYFSYRHNSMPVIGLILLFTVLVDGIARSYDLQRRAQWVLLGAAMAVSSLAFLPPAFTLSSEFDHASEVVERVRARIERETAGLPPGRAIRLKNVPQYFESPFYFGWGLQSSLKKPFTESDLANKSLVVNLKNIRANRYQVEIPEQFHLTVSFHEKWRPPRPGY
jgi:hypothetical protein